MAWGLSRGPRNRFEVSPAQALDRRQCSSLYSPVAPLTRKPAARQVGGSATGHVPPPVVQAEHTTEAGAGGTCVPCFCISGQAIDNPIVHHGILEPGIHLLHKPFDPEELARKVR